MQVNGNQEFDISRKQLWGYLMDPDVLAKITPGISKLELIDIDTYKTVSDIKIGPVKGKFTGKLKVVEKNEPSSFSIEMEQLSKIGNAHATIAMNLDENGTGSSLGFDGKAKLSGVIARTGQRVLSGVANAITKEVFASLQAHIDEEKVNGDSNSMASGAIDDPAIMNVLPDAKVTTVANDTVGKVVEQTKNVIAEAGKKAQTVTHQASIQSSQVIRNVKEAASEKSLWQRILAFFR